MSTLKIAVKAFIVNDGKLLIVKRAENDRYMPGTWEVPGGKLEHGEDFISGLKREVKEETGIDIEVNRLISQRDFERPETKIKMFIFLCNSVNFNIKLSKEHSRYEWIEFNKCKEKISDFYFPEVELLLDFENEKWP